MPQPLKLPHYNWERDALVSLCLAISASIYSLTPGFEKWVCIMWLTASLAFGVWSVIKQLRAGKVNVVYFDHTNWVKDAAGNWLLVIESDLMLFRVEQPDGNGKFQEVMGDVLSDPDGKKTYISFTSNTTESDLSGRVVIR